MFPLLTLADQPSQHLPAVLDPLSNEGCEYLASNPLSRKRWEQRSEVQSLWDLARAHDMTWEDLYNFEGNNKRLKSGDPHWIYPGETLRFPAASSAAKGAFEQEKGVQDKVVQDKVVQDKVVQQGTPPAKRVILPVERQDDGATSEPGTGPTKTLPPAQKKPDLQGPLG